MRATAPNILFVLSDQHRGDFTTRDPLLPLRTPALDDLASRGVSFSNVTTPSPLCAPTRACLASGREYDRCGVPNNMVDYPLDQTTYYSLLRDAGYWVVGVGKLDLHKTTEYWGLDGSRLLPDWGFSAGMDCEGKLDAIRSGAEKPMGPYMAYLHERGLAAVHVADLRGRHPYKDTHPTPLPDDAYCDNWIAANALRVLEQSPTERPWHLVVNFAGPHDPMDVTASMQARWRGVTFPPPVANTDCDAETHNRIRQNYAAMIENIDTHVGRLVEQVKARGELDRTVVIYASDHGEMLGDHNVWGKATYYRPSLTVPLIVAGAGVRSGLESDAIVAFHDLAATILDYGGSPVPADMDSRSIRPLLQGQRENHREYAIAGLVSTEKQLQRLAHYQSDTAANALLRNWRSIHDGRHKLVLSVDRPPVLFDLQDDPQEMVDVAADRSEIVETLAGRLAAELGEDWELRYAGS